MHKKYIKMHQLSKRSNQTMPPIWTFNVCVLVYWTVKQTSSRNSNSVIYMQRKRFLADFKSSLHFPSFFHLQKWSYVSKSSFDITFIRNRFCSALLGLYICFILSFFGLSETRSRSKNQEEAYNICSRRRIADYLASRSTMPGKFCNLFLFRGPINSLKLKFSPFYFIREVQHGQHQQNWI